jgi:hypothetical protein
MLNVNVELLVLPLTLRVAPTGRPESSRNTFVRSGMEWIGRQGYCFPARSIVISGAKYALSAL